MSQDDVTAVVCCTTYKLTENQENILPDLYDWRAKIKVTFMLYGT